MTGTATTSSRVAAALCLGLLLSACGSRAGGKELSGQGSCDLITPGELSGVLGGVFGAGEREGAQCLFASGGGPLPRVSISSGIRTTTQPTGVGVHAKVENTEVDGVAAEQISTRPRGSSCVIDVLLVPEDSGQVFSVTFNGTSDGEESCASAKKVASAILGKLQG
ncbi:DUF3558 family protein [Amycolatopsis nigrescens]|uniref:DUF3558 family protein n=1 Tax=Amycolatopsis nigrescens TaxID=381445 RepID=UPI000382CDFB|nr:DUF3558 family protein [Amycolatopsis nigrescens]